MSQTPTKQKHMNYEKGQSSQNIQKVYEATQFFYHMKVGMYN